MTVQSVGSTSNVQPLVPSEASAAPESTAASLLTSPDPNIDVGQAIATLSIESSFERKRIARSERNTAEKAQHEAEQRQLSEMEKQADEKYAAAKWNAIGEIVSGGTSLAGAGIALGAKSNNQAWMQTGEAGGKVMDGSFKLVGAYHDREASSAEVAAKAAEQTAGHAKTMIDDARDDADSAKESIRKALDFLKDYQSAQQQSQAAAIHRS